MIYFIGYDHCAMWAQERYRAFNLQAYSLHHTVEHFEASLSRMPQGSAVLLSGQTAFSIAQGQGWFPKNRKVSTHAGQVKHVPERGVHIIPCIDTLDVDNNPHKIQQLDYFITLAHRVATTGNAAPDLSEYDLQYADNLDDVMVDLAFAGKDRKRIPVSVDLETEGLDAFDPERSIVTLQVSTGPKKARVVPWPPKPIVIEQLRELLNNPGLAIIGANLSFDLLWLRHKHGIECTNFVFDCMVVDSLIDNKRPHSLEMMTKHYCPHIGGYDDAMNALDKSQMREHYNNDPAAFLGYAGMDTCAALQVFQAQRAELLRDPKLTRFYNEILHPAGIELMNHEYTGIHVDGDMHEEIREEFVDKSAECFRTAFNHLKVMDRAKYADRTSFTPTMITDYLFGPRYLNLRPQQTTATGKIATSEAALRKVKSESAQPFINAILDQSKYNKIVSTYLDGFSQHIRHDGWYHPSYLQAWTNTGRLSASSPAILTIPKHSAYAKRLRECYTPPPGYEILGVDFDSGELYIHAHLSNNLAMQKTLAEGGDIHEKTGRAFYEAIGLDPDENPKKTRQSGKPGNFGCLARGTLIKTDQGDIPIEQVSAAHKVFDGVSWVPCEGAVCTGSKPVICYRGLTATPDHIVFAHYGNEVIACGLAEAARRKLLLVSTTLNNSEVDFYAAAYTRRRFNKVGGYGFKRRRLFVGDAATYGYRLAGLCSMQTMQYSRGEMGKQFGTRARAILPMHWYTKVFRQSGECFGDAVRRYCTALQGHWIKATKKLRPPRNSEQIQISPTFHRIHVAGAAAPQLQGGGYRSDRQRWPLSAWEFEISQPKAEFSEPVETWDILNAGPNHRYQTACGKLVGNCIYLISNTGMVAYAEQFGVTLTEDSGQTFIDTFMRDNPAVPVYHELQKQIVERDGRVQSPLGRWRQLPEVRASDQSLVRKAYRAAVNFPTQATLSDCNQWACAILGKEYPQLEQFLLFHDAIYFYIEKGSASYWMPKIRDVMENLPLERFQMYMNVGLQVSFELYRDHWGHAVEFNRDGTEKKK